MGTAWTRDGARQALRARLVELSSALVAAEGNGQRVATLACILVQQRDGCRLQLFERERPPHAAVGEVLEESARQVPERGQDRLPVVLLAIDGRLWVTWVRAIPLVPGGDA